MTCGQAAMGGCFDEDPFHEGPCKVTPDETPEQQAYRSSRKQFKAWSEGYRTGRLPHPQVSRKAPQGSDRSRPDHPRQLAGANQVTEQNESTEPTFTDVIGSVINSLQEKHLSDVAYVPNQEIFQETVIDAVIFGQNDAAKYNSERVSSCPNESLGESARTAWRMEFPEKTWDSFLTARVEPLMTPLFDRLKEQSKEIRTQRVHSREGGLAVKSFEAEKKKFDDALAEKDAIINTVRLILETGYSDARNDLRSAVGLPPLESK